MNDLEKLRDEIDHLDREIVALLHARAAKAEAIGAIKQARGKPVLDPQREMQVLRNVLDAGTGVLSDEALTTIYSAILSVSRALQRPLAIAYLGPAATNAHQAARCQFGDAATYLPSQTIAEVFLRTEKAEADYGVVPVENSSEGMVSNTLDMFVESDLKVSAEVLLPISHNLLAKCELQEIKRVCSHPQALAQSRGWLGQNLPGVELVETSSTARAAELAAVEAGTAAVANALAASVYGLNVLASRIEDSTQNFTRFLVIGQHTSERSGNDKTALLFSIKDRIGALHDVLAAFQSNDINLAKIESRPSRRRAWEYIFFVDLLGHPDDPAVQRALAELGAECDLVKVLGAWPIQRPI